MAPTLWVYLIYAMFALLHYNSFVRKQKQKITNIPIPKKNCPNGCFMIKGSLKIEVFKEHERSAVLTLEKEVILEEYVL